MRLGFQARRVRNAARRHISPPAGVMRPRDYWATRRVSHFTAGQSMVCGRPVRYSNLFSFSQSVIERLKDQINQFKADNDSLRFIYSRANIGLSVLFFKELYPDEKMGAYELDRDLPAPLRECWPFAVRSFSRSRGVEG